MRGTKPDIDAPTYGPRADFRNSIYKLIRQALEQQKIIYHGSGDELREFIHVQDAAKSSVQILEPAYENTYITLTGREKMRYDDLLYMGVSGVGPR